MKSEIKKIRMEPVDNIPTLPGLALKYGTISKDQHDYLIKLFAFKKERVDYEALLRDEEMATPYQIDLLKLIQEYQIIRKSGEEFGKIATSKGLATDVDINQALDMQKKEFKRSRQKKLIGDILVETHILTTKQKNLILKEQAVFAKPDYGLSREIHQPSTPTEEGRGQNAVKLPEICITVSSDCMTAWLERAASDEAAMTLEQIKNAVLADGIVSGVYPDAFLQCFLDAGVKRFPVAHIEPYDFSMHQNRFFVYVVKDNGEPIEKKPGEVLIELADAALKAQIENVYGEKVPFVAGNEFPVRCGENTRWSRDKTKILAAKPGNPSFSAGKKVFVHPVVRVLEDADFRFGPIEPYADLSVSGTLTGAYPVTTGKLSTGEIRGANIDAIGDIHARVGITDATIRAEGDVYARYVHNSTIETFGSVYVQNEIIDAQIRCGGKFESPNCRVISSKIYAKRGVVLSGVGSERSKPSTIVAGGEHLVIAFSVTILDKINDIYGQLEILKEERKDRIFQSEKIFKKMVELKTFHDKAKKKKNTLLSELDEKKGHINKKILTNIQKLISSYDKQMNSSLVSLKAMNTSKKEHDIFVEELERKIAVSATQAEQEILSLEKMLFAYLEKAKENTGDSVIDIKEKAYAGTMLGGVYQSLAMSDDGNAFKVKEVLGQGAFPELQFVPALHKS